MTRRVEAAVAGDHERLRGHRRAQPRRRACMLVAQADAAAEAREGEREAAQRNAEGRDRAAVDAARRRA